MTGWNNPLSKAEMDAMRDAEGVRRTLRAFRPGGRNERNVRERFWPRFRAIARHVPFAQDVLAAFFCATDPRTPLRVRAILFAALVYFLWPGSAIPRFAIAIGLLDEAAVLLMTVRTLGGAIKPEHYEKARAVLHAREAA